MTVSAGKGWRQTRTWTGTQKQIHHSAVGGQCSQGEHVDRHPVYTVPPGVMALNKSLNISCLFPKCFQQYVKRYRWAQPCRIAETTHNQRLGSLWVLGWYGKTAKAILNSPWPHSQQNFPICWPASGTYNPFAWCELLIFSVQTPSAKVQANPEKPPPHWSPGL